MTWFWGALGALVTGVLGFWLGGRRSGHRIEQIQQDIEEGRRELKQRMKEISSLQELSYLLADTISLEGIADQVAQYVDKFVASDGVLVALIDAASRRVRVVGASGTLKSLKGQTADYGTPSLVTRTMASQSLDTATASVEQPVAVFGNERRSGTLAAAPLQAHGEILGAIALVRDTYASLADTDLRLLTTAAAYTAIALGNARFVELIRTGKDQWEATFDAITDGIAVVDEQGHIRRANRALGTMVNVRVVDLIGKALAPLLAVDQDLVRQVIESSRRDRPQPLIARSDQLKRGLRLTAASIEGGETARYVILVEDVTEEQALEAAAIQSEKMAAVGQLVSGVAHELNNPLTSITGLTEFLQQQPYIDHRGEKHLAVIHEQSNRAAAIVRNLLTFARPPSPGTASVDMNDVVRRTVTLTNYEMKLREIDLAMDLDTRATHVAGDLYQLQQVVLNLITNAIQAVAGNPPGRTRRITITTSRTDQAVVVDVGDSGPGIPDDVAAKVFEPFFTTKKPGEGTGLGLSITYGIVQSHGGDIRVAAGEESGARFVVSLPAAQTEEPESAQRAKPVTSGPRAPDSGGSVLLVDRDAAVRQMIDLVFSHDGHTVVIADPDDRPDVALQTGNYDLVLADPRVPVSTGDSFADWVRREHPDILNRIIFLTADVRPETTEWLERTGCRFFHKPFNVHELKEAADRLLSDTVSEA